MKKKRLLLGAHMSVAGGLDKSFDRGREIGCTCMQIFTKSNRQWKAKPITAPEAEAFKKQMQSCPISPVVAHASYLINIGASDPTLRERSINALIEELARCEQLNIPYLVLHPGSCGADGTPAECIGRISDGLSYIFNTHPGSTKILLENTAGQGTSVGHTFEQLRSIYDGVENKTRLGFCFDTCHAFAAGYDFRTEETYNAMWQQFNELLSYKNLHAIHLNDSKKGLGSRVDRHEHIGHGLIGSEAFELIFNDPILYDIPKILETPKEAGPDENHEYAQNMEKIKGYLTEKTKKDLHI